MEPTNRPVDMVTWSGHGVWYDRPELTPIDWNDIDKALPNICRYNGHLDVKLSTHLHLCGAIAEQFFEQPKLAAYAAAHDIHEIYMTDVVNGMKKHLPNYSPIEHQWEQHVHRQLGLPWDERPALVKEIDMVALCIEMDQLKHPAAKYVAKQCRIDLESEGMKDVVSIGREFYAYGVPKNSAYSMKEIKRYISAGRGIIHQEASWQGR